MTLLRQTCPGLILIRGVYLLMIFAACVICTNAQTTRPLPPVGDDVSTIANEMRARWEIKYAEKGRLENLDRAREVGQLASEMSNTYSRTNVFSATEKKKLDRMEKVTRKIRSLAGGSDGDVVIDNMPSQLGPALKRLTESAAEFRKAVENTPRQVISASVIERSNEVLEIIRYLRAWTR